MSRFIAIVSFLVATAFYAPASFADDWDDCRTGEPKSSIRACTAIIDSEPKETADLAEAHYLRGKARSTRKEYSQAVTDFDRVIELEPRNADAFAERGRAHEEQENYDLARRDYEHAATLYPSDARYGSRDEDGSESGDDADDTAETKKPAATKSKRAKKKRANRKKATKKQRSQKKAKSKKKRKKYKQARKKKSKPKENIRAKINKQVGCTVAGGFDC